MTSAARYCELFKLSGMTPRAFALYALVRYRALCDRVLAQIGSWPSSEPELAALQRTVA